MDKSGSQFEPSPAHSTRATETRTRSTLVLGARQDGFFPITNNLPSVVRLTYFFCSSEFGTSKPSCRCVRGSHTILKKKRRRSRSFQVPRLPLNYTQACRSHHRSMISLTLSRHSQPSNLLNAIISKTTPTCRTLPSQARTTWAKNTSRRYSYQITLPFV